MQSLPCMKLVIFLNRIWTLHLNKSRSPAHRRSISKTFLPSLSPSLHVSYSVWKGGSLGTSVGQLSREGGGGGGGGGGSVTANQLLPPRLAQPESSSRSCLTSAAHSHFLELQHFTSSTQYVIWHFFHLTFLINPCALTTLLNSNNTVMQKNCYNFVTRVA